MATDQISHEFRIKILYLIPAVHTQRIVWFTGSTRGQVGKEQHWTSRELQFCPWKRELK